MRNTARALKRSACWGKRDVRPVRLTLVECLTARPQIILAALPESLAKQVAAKDAYKYGSAKGCIMSVDRQAATDRLMRFLAVEGVTGKEAAIGRELTAALEESGVPAGAIRLDDANTRIPVPTETGNLIVDLPGRGATHNQTR